MNPVTILIQGLLNKPRFEKSLDHYKEVSRGNVILSTWECHKDLVDPSWDIKVVYAKPPKFRFFNVANVGCQCLTMINGLRYVNTPYVVKVRSDEYRTNMYHFLGKMFVNSDKIVTDNVFFRPTNHRMFHCGDHSQGAKTSHLTAMFTNALEILKKYPMCDSKKGLSPEAFGLEERYNMDGVYAEQFLVFGYLKYKKEKIDQDRATEIMRRNFECVDVRDMGEYIINCNNCASWDNALTYDRFREWNDDRTQFGSIRSMDELDMPRLNLEE